jgi:outer membrane protein assembly factor BamB
VLRAVNKLTGKLLWTYRTEDQILGSANIWTSGKRSGIVFGSYDYFLHCVDPAKGGFLWKTETGNYVNGAPAIGDNAVIFGGCDGIIRMIDR